MLRSVSRMVLPSWRPIVISSRMSGTTVVFPSSSSIVSLNTAGISIRGPCRMYRWAFSRSIGDLRQVPDTPSAPGLFDENERCGNDDRHAQDEGGDDDRDGDVLVL